VRKAFYKGEFFVENSVHDIFTKFFQKFLKKFLTIINECGNIFRRPKKGSGKIEEKPWNKKVFGKFSRKSFLGLKSFGS